MPWLFIEPLPSSKRQLLGMMLVMVMMLMMMMMIATTMQMMIDARTIGTCSRTRTLQVSPHLNQRDAFGYGHMEVLFATVVSSFHCRFSGALFP